MKKNTLLSIALLLLSAPGLARAADGRPGVAGLRAVARVEPARMPTFRITGLEPEPLPAAGRIKTQPAPMPTLRGSGLKPAPMPTWAGAPARPEPSGAARWSALFDGALGR